MAMTDPLGDLLTRIRNGQQARKDSILTPASKLRSRVLDVLQREGYIRGDIVVHGAWTGPSALDLQSHALAPLTQLPVLEVVSGFHLVADFTLPLGEVVHDYLA